jgi:hypothetical protein
MIRFREGLRDRVIAGLLTRRDAGHYAWYLTRQAARRIRDARPYTVVARVPPQGEERLTRKDGGPRHAN